MSNAEISGSQCLLAIRWIDWLAVLFINRCYRMGDTLIPVVYQWIDDTVYYVYQCSCHSICLLFACGRSNLGFLYSHNHSNLRI